MLKRILIFAYGVLSYGIFFLTFLYAVGFIGNMVVPKTLDSARQVPVVQAVLIDLLVQRLNVGVVLIGGPEEAAMVGRLIKQLKTDGVGIFLVTHDMPDVFALSDRLAVMKNGRLVGTYRTADVTEDEVLGMIIAGKRPERKAQAEHA